MKQTIRAKKKRIQGFTLVEVMVVVAIVSILIMVAYPSYVNFMVQANRGTAQSDLMAFAAAMERHKAANLTYAGAATGGGDTGAPRVYASHSPSDEPAASKRYDLRIEAVNGTGTRYELIAEPVSGSIQDDDGALHYFSDGRKAWDQNGDGSLATSEFCWSC